MNRTGSRGGNRDHSGKKVLIIGGGIAGLCAAVYALRCGYRVEVVEMHETAGGLATSWRRNPYTFETCLHWLVGSAPQGDLHAQWQEVCDIDRLTFVNLDEFVCLRDERGGVLHIWTNVDRLQQELLRCAPDDAGAILELTRAIRLLGKFRLPDPSSGLTGNWLNVLRDVPYLPLLRKLSRTSGGEYGRRFTHPLLRAFFSSGDVGRMSSLAMIFSLAWMNQGNAGYCIGGSRALIRLIEEKIAEHGGTIRFNARVRRILVDHDTAIGVELADGETLRADWIISAADGHSTLFDLLDGRYLDKETRGRYERGDTFASYIQVSLGIARDLSDEPPMTSWLLKKPLIVDPATELGTVGFRFFHFDLTFAPPGKTAVTCLLPTRNFEYWTQLRQADLPHYRAEKQRLADTIVTLLDRQVPDVRDSIEVVDVSTPATVFRYTGNWRGSMEGWLLLPGESFRPLSNTLPGLHRFVMAGQWVMPGGGLPSGPLTARPAVKLLCREDHVPFELRASPKPELVGS